MTDFSKVHGPDHDPAKLYREENQQLKQTINALQNELIARAQPTLGEVSDALGAFARAASGGHPQAKTVLKNFFDALDAGREAAGKITIIRNGN